MFFNRCITSGLDGFGEAAGELLGEGCEDIVTNYRNSVFFWSLK